MAHVPHGHWRTTTFVARLAASGLTAPLGGDGRMNGSVFLVYVQHQLAPALLSGDILIFDRLSAHKVAGVREVAEAGGAQLVFLPLYSTDLIRIEQAFAKLKSLLRKAAERTVAVLKAAIG